MWHPSPAPGSLVSPVGKPRRGLRSPCAGLEHVVERYEQATGPQRPRVLGRPATGSVQCQAVLAMTVSQFRSALSEASNVATSTSTLLRRADK